MRWSLSFQGTSHKQPRWGCWIVTCAPDFCWIFFFFFYFPICSIIQSESGTCAFSSGKNAFKIGMIGISFGQQNWSTAVVWCKFDLPRSQQNTLCRPCTIRFILVTSASQFHCRKLYKCLLRTMSLVQWSWSRSLTWMDECNSGASSDVRAWAWCSEVGLWRYWMNVHPVTSERIAPGCLMRERVLHGWFDSARFFFFSFLRLYSSRLSFPRTCCRTWKSFRRCQSKVKNVELFIKRPCRKICKKPNLTRLRTMRA